MYGNSIIYTKQMPKKYRKRLKVYQMQHHQAYLNMQKNENSELHKCFEWDDTVAAEKYRLQQARNIVCNLVYQEEKKEEPTKLRVFYNQSSTNTYQPTRVLVRNEDSYKELLMQAKSELRAFKNKYKMLTELEDIFELID